ncbi:hypothetical protein [Burkholderia sp. LMG 21824]|uniref:hypothetical protein n=1 Tax=Burkholderia sp. LMG 21824 TaxID=3158172 RepID=UPI003C2DE932
MIGSLVKIGHKGGRPRGASSDEIVAAIVRVASIKPLTRGQIVQRLAAEFGPLSFGHLDTLSEALERESFTFKRSRLSLRKSATRRRSP